MNWYGVLHILCIIYCLLCRRRSNEDIHLCSASDRAACIPATCRSRRLAIIMRSRGLYNRRSVQLLNMVSFVLTQTLCYYYWFIIINQSDSNRLPIYRLIWVIGRVKWKCLYFWHLFLLLFNWYWKRGFTDGYRPHTALYTSSPFPTLQ